MKIQKSALILFSKRILWVILIYQLCRLFFYFLNRDLLSPLSFIEILGGFRFDLSVIGYVNLIFVLLFLFPASFTSNVRYQKIVFCAFYVVNLLVMLPNFIDLEYYRFTNRRSTFSLITASGMQNEILGLLPSYIKQYWLVTVSFIVFAVGFWKVLPKYKPTQEKVKFNFPSLLVMLLVCGIFFVMGRGGIQQKPIRIVDANLYTQTTNSSVVLNTPFCIFKTINKEEKLDQYQYFSEEELNQIFNPIIEFKNKTPNRKNVVLIILESFGKENLNIGQTPFLDSLALESLYFENSFANGRLSIDAVPSTVSSIPSMMNTSLISSSYSVNEIKALPSILNEHGYYTAFFHGAFNGSQNFDQYAKKAQFTNYFGKDEYIGPEAFDGKWGIFDEEFLQFFAQKMDSFKQPFFTTIFTISSHAPFVIPQKYKGKFPKGTTEIHESIAYSDYALKQFFITASQMPWYQNTLFIITADHTSATHKPEEYNNTLGKFKIPIIFFEPGNEEMKGVNHKYIQQIDIYPSILDYLGINSTILSYGKSYLSDKDFVVNYVDNTYNYISGEYYLLFDGKKSLALYDLKTDPYQKNNILKQNPDKVLEMEKFIKAYIQSFNYRMSNNKLIVD